MTFAFISGANAQGGTSSDIVTNVEKRTFVKLPIWYTEKIRNFTINNKVLKDKDATQFTEDFILKEIQSNRWISKENQLLFIYCAIWYNFSQDFYTWDDWDDNRMIEFEKVIDTIENCQTRYKEDFISYMQQRSAEAERRSAEAERRSAEADSLTAQYRRETAENDSLTAQYRRESAKALKENMKTDSLWLKEIIKFYHIYERNPKIVRQEEIAQAKENAKRFINDCIKHWINYRAILLKEVWDKRKVEEILKFYGVE